MKHLLSLERLDVGRTLALTVGSPSAHRRGTMLKHYAFMLLFLIAGIGQAWGTDPVSTLNFSAKCNGSGTADDEMTWTITSDGTESNFDSEKGIHYGTNNAAVTNIVLTSASFGDNKTITKVVVEASGNNSPSLSVTVGGIAFGETKTGITTTNTSYTFEPTEAQSENDYKGAVVVTLAKSSSAKKAIYVKSVAVTYTSGGSQEPTVFRRPFKKNFQSGLLYNIYKN